MVRRAALVTLTFWMIAGAPSAYAEPAPADLVRSGSEAAETGQWDEAIAVLTKAIPARELSIPERALAYHSRGYAYVATGEIDRAIADYSQAIRLMPNDPEYHSQRGWAYFLKGAMKQAIADSSSAIKLDPTLVFAYRNRGRAQLYSGHAKAAADDFAAAVRLMPSDTLGVIWLHVARVRTGQDDVDEFRANVAKLDRSQWPGALLEAPIGAATPEHIRDIASATGADHRERLCDADVYFGLLQLAAGEKDQARALFQAAVAECRVGIMELTELTVAQRELKGLGERAAPNGNRQRETKPQAPLSESERGFDDYQQGKMDRAIADSTRAIRREPNDARNYQLRALASFASGAMDRAIADATTVLRLEPNSAVALRVRGLARLYRGQPKLAAEDFAEAVRVVRSDALGVILLHVARARAQQLDAEEFRNNVARVERQEWPGPLMEVLTGGMSIEQVREVASSTGDEHVRRDQVCEAHVYLGLLQLTANEKNEAQRLFSAAKSDCPVDAAEAVELAIGKLELNRLATAAPRRSAPTNTAAAEPPAQAGDPRR